MGRLQGAELLLCLLMMDGFEMVQAPCACPEDPAARKPSSAHVLLLGERFGL